MAGRQTAVATVQQDYEYGGSLLRRPVQVTLTGLSKAEAEVADCSPRARAYTLFAPVGPIDPARIVEQIRRVLADRAATAKQIRAEKESV